MHLQRKLYIPLRFCHKNLPIVLNEFKSCLNLICNKPKNKITLKKKNKRKKKKKQSTEIK